MILSDFSSFWHRVVREIYVESKSEITPCYAARPYKFGNTEQDALGRDYRNKRTIGPHISAKNPFKMHLFETVAMETENNFVYTTKA